MAGRVARGEVWQFDEFASETRLSVDGRLRYLDRFRLSPATSAPGSPWRMGNARYLATGLCVDPHADDLSARLHDSLPRAGVDTPAAETLVARVAEADGLDFHRARSAFAALGEFDGR
jgi:urease accessory protein UreH